WMNAADVLLLTSISEGSPTVVKEAMACNLPVVTVPVGDVRERLAGVAHCHVVEPGPEPLADALENVLSSGARSNGRQFAGSLDVAQSARQVAEIYET